MEWSRLISDKRLGMEEYHCPGKHIRTDFQRDYDRMIFSSPFRRLQNKTQVFPLPGSIFVHNRLTHSLEVSSVGRSLANEIAICLRDKYSDPDADRLFYNLGDIVAAACLCHDIGNPPFGHSGEQTIGSFFREGGVPHLNDTLTRQQWTDIVHFEGNANSFRVLTHQFYGRRAGGFAMTYSTLASIVKYPYSSLYAGDKGKFGFFESEENIFRKIADELGIISDGSVYARHPLVYVMEAADDICYQIMDLEDSHKLRILSTMELIDLLSLYFIPEERGAELRKLDKVSDPNEKIAFLRSKVIGKLVNACCQEFVKNEDAILSGRYRGSLIDNLSGSVAEGYSACSDMAWKKIYRSHEVVDIEIAGNRIITYLLGALLEAVLYPQKNASRLLLEQIPEQYETHSHSIYSKVQSILDHISAMTDVYALNLYRKLNGHSLPAV